MHGPLRTHEVSAHPPTSTPPCLYPNACSIALEFRGSEREEYGLRVTFAELDKRDNAELATSAAAIVGAFGQLHDKGLIGDTDLLDICYRLAHPEGTRAPRELVDVEQGRKVA